MKVFKYSIFAILCSCSVNYDSKYIESHEWILVEGDVTKMGDVLTFDKSGLYRIRKDSIYKRGNFVGLVKELDTLNGEVTIESIDGQEVGIWADKSKMYDY